MDSYLVPLPSPSSADKPAASLTNKESMCIQCNRQFQSKTALRSHEKDSPKHKIIPKVPPRASSRITKAPAAGLNRREDVKENNNIEEPDLGHQSRPLPLPRRRLNPPKASALKGDPDVGIGLIEVDLLVDGLVLTFFEAGPDATKTASPVASLPVEDQEKNANSESYGLVVPEVPAPWSSIPLSERDVVLDALQAQCHSMESLAGEGYWTQTPSPVDIDMTRKCSDCGGKESSEYLNGSH